MATYNGTPGNDSRNDTVNSADLYNMGDGNDTVLAGPGNDTINGDAGNDSLYGQAGADRIFGGTGNDTMDGGADADRLYGGDGDDYFIDGNANGADSLFGGAGSDTADYSASTTAIIANLSGATDTVNPAGDGNNDRDTLVGVENIIGSNLNDSIVGDIQNNFFSGLDGVDTLIGLSGDDTLRGGDGADVISGGIGSDWADYSTSNAGVNVTLNDTLAESGGHAQGDVLTGIDNLLGSDHSDTLVGDNSANVISGGGGADTITGNLGSDSIDGGAGNDFITAGPTSGGVSGSAQNLRFDWITDATHVNTGGGVGDETNLLSRPNFTQTINNQMTVEVDYVQGVGSAYRVEQGPTFDGLPDGGNGLYTAGGVVQNNSGAYLERSGAGEMTEMSFNFSAVDPAVLSNEVTNVTFTISDIDIGNYTDVVSIYAYDELGNLVPVVVTPGATGGMTVTNLPGGAKQIVATTGGGGQPTSPSGGVLVQIAGPVAQVVIQYTDANDSLQYIIVSDVNFTTIPAAVGGDDDTVNGGDGDDTILGGFGDDSLSGGSGADSLLGQDGDDELLGGDGADGLYGGAGNDSISGGIGADSIYGGDGNDSIEYGAGADSVYGGAGDDYIDDSIGGVETGANYLDGGTGNDTIWAGDGADTIIGDAGNDLINAEAGSDTVSGGAGNDTIYGGDGADSIDAGADRDSVYGGAGEDLIIGGSGTDSLYGGADNDVFDFTGTETFTFSDSLNPEIIDGGGSLVGDTIPGDFDTIDLSEYGWDRIVIVSTGDEEGYIYIYTDSSETVLLGVIRYTEIEEIIPCFTPGTMILTDRGEVAVEALLIGDLVMTRDNGLQPLRWVGQRKLSALDLQADPDLQPVRIAKGALSGAGPDRSMLVSPQHRVLIEGARAELLFGEAEVLVPAKHLVGLADVSRALPADGVTYIHILFDRHEIVQSDGLWTESFQPGERTLSAMDDAVRAEVLALFPQLEQGTDAFDGARLSLKAHEARVLFAAE